MSIRPTRIPAHPVDETLRIEKYKVSVYDTHMRYIPRDLTDVILRAKRRFPAVVVTGPRRHEMAKGDGSDLSDGKPKERWAEVGDGWGEALSLIIIA